MIRSKEGVIREVNPRETLSGPPNSSVTGLSQWRPGLLRMPFYSAGRVLGRSPTVKPSDERKRFLPVARFALPREPDRT